MKTVFDIAVIGGGLTGATAALACSRRGYSTVFVAPGKPVSDARTTALMMPSVQLLDELGIWTDVADIAGPLRCMRIIDGTNRLIRAPTVTFHAGELDIEAFGYNVPNSPLLTALSEAVSRNPAVFRYDSPLKSAVEGSDRAQLILTDNTEISASLVVAADGRESVARASAGISVRNWSYPQTAIVLNVSHAFDHADTCNEIHTEDGPLTQVPLPGRQSSIVWAQRPADIDRLLSLSKDQLASALEERMDTMLGGMVVESGIQQFPFRGMIARAFGKGRTLLVGEAGHVFPPIGAQGLNLGLRDVLELTDSISAAGGPQNASEAVRRYNRSRRGDIISRTIGADMLNRTLLNGFLPLQFARSAALASLSSIAPLRNFAMREGMKPGGGMDVFRRDPDLGKDRRATYRS
ncbi:MAG: UbiH/UbiF family hydroxylase [Pseudomonadota bacterium]